MELVAYSHLDFSLSLVKGLGHLRERGDIFFDYYPVPPIYIGGGEYMLASEILDILLIFKNALELSRPNIILIPQVDVDRATFQFYLKEVRIESDLFKKISEKRSLYTYLLGAEYRWKKIGLKISAHNVEGENECCFSFSFDLKSRVI